MQSVTAFRRNQYIPFAVTDCLFSVKPKSRKLAELPTKFTVFENTSKKPICYNHNIGITETNVVTHCHSSKLIESQYLHNQFSGPQPNHELNFRKIDNVNKLNFSSSTALCKTFSFNFFRSHPEFCKSAGILWTRTLEIKQFDFKLILHKRVVIKSRQTKTQDIELDTFKWAAQDPPDFCKSAGILRTQVYFIK